MKTMPIKKITKRHYPSGKDAYCLSVDNPEHEVLVVGSSGRNYRIGQTVNFGILYGRTAYGLSKGLGMTPDAAEKFIKRYFSKFKKIEIFIQQAHNTLEKNYAIRTILNRKRRFPDYAQARKEQDWKLAGHIKRQATNAIIQGSAADMIKIQMRNLGRALVPYDGHILISVHDELIIEVPKDRSEELMKLVKYEMENALKLPGVPIITEPHTCDRWTK